MIQIKLVSSWDHHMISNIYHEIRLLQNNYPNFSLWFAKVACQLNSTTRKMYVALDKGKIAGVLILKRDNEENKICTLRVSEHYRGQGIGSRLMNIAITELKTNKPLITVSGAHINEFSGILSKYGFELRQKCKDYYCKGDYEYAFNGVLVPNSFKLSEAI